MNQGKKTAVEAVEEKRGLICQAADQIWEYAELSLQEEKSAAYYCRVLRQEGFAVEEGICGIPTAFPPALEREAPELEFLRSMMLCQACPRRRDAQEQKEHIPRGLRPRLRPQPARRGGYGCGPWREGLSGENGKGRVR